MVCSPVLWVGMFRVPVVDVAVAACDIVMVVTFVATLILVLAGIPVPVMVAPMSPVVKCAVADVSVVLPLVTWASATERAIPDVVPGHMKIWIIDPRSFCGSTELLQSPPPLCFHCG